MAATEQSIGIVGPGVILDGILRVPERATGLVLFAHGSGVTMLRAMVRRTGVMGRVSPPAGAGAL